MKLVDTIRVWYQGDERHIMLFVGDLAALPEQEAVDLLVVSAFPDDYAPTSSSLIGALARTGVSVAGLAADKEVDLRRFSSCWLSRLIGRPDLHFRRILCFEPSFRGRAPEVVGDVFRSLVPLVTSDPPIRQVAMPLLASGDQGESDAVMLKALIEASIHWLSAGLPVDRLKIVAQDSADLPRLRDTFACARQRQQEAKLGGPRSDSRYDVFVSYSHSNVVAVDVLVAQMRALRPSLRVFLDRLELRLGASWQQHIFEALDASHRVICIYSPDYLASKVCQEEFNVGLMRHRETEDGVLLPVYAYTAELPTYMRLIQYEDVREGDRTKMAHAAERLLSQL